LKTIAWDIDDVLNDLMLMWFGQKWIKDHRECRLRYEELTENPPHGLLGVDINDYLSSLDEYRLSGLYQQMLPVKEVMDWFVKYGNKFRHIALTAVPLVASSASAQWVFKYYGAWIRTFHFVPSRREGQEIPEYEKDKGDFLKWISKVDLLVDDNKSNIVSAENAGCKGILIPRPWNESKIPIEKTLLMIPDMA
jgi:hypothetical protein